MQDLTLRPVAPDPSATHDAPMSRDTTTHVATRTWRCGYVRSRATDSALKLLPFGTIWAPRLPGGQVPPEGVPFTTPGSLAQNFDS